MISQKTKAKIFSDPNFSSLYLKFALDDGFNEFMDAIKTIVQARGLAKIAKKARMSPEELLDQLTTKKIRIREMSHVVEALGLRLAIVTKSKMRRETAPKNPPKLNFDHFHREFEKLKRNYTDLDGRKLQPRRMPS